MVVDRSYLPYKSAREYQDRKMKKWMGFFLSEHTSALNKANEFQESFERMNNETKFILLGQAYAQQLHLLFTYKDNNNRLQKVEGVVNTMSIETIGIKLDQDYYLIRINDLVRVDLCE